MNILIIILAIIGGIAIAATAAFNIIMAINAYGVRQEDLANGIEETNSLPSIALVVLFGYQIAFCLYLITSLLIDPIKEGVSSWKIKKLKQGDT